MVDGRGLALPLVAFTRPGLLAPLNRAWTKLGLLLFKVVSPVMMALLYVTTIVPIGLFMRCDRQGSAAFEFR